MRQARRILGWFLLLFGACLLAAGSSWAGSVDTFGIGSRATALGGAYAANAEGPFAAYYNPAGLTQTERPVASAGLMVMDPNLEAKNYSVENSQYPDLGPKDISDESDNLYPPHLGVAMPINNKWSVGLAAYAPFGLHLEWQNDPDKNPASYNSYESWYERQVVTPTVAYRVNDKISLGLGVSLGKSEAGHYYNLYGLNMLGRKLTAAGAPYWQNGPITGAIEGDLNDSFNYSANLGLMYRPTKNWSMGLTYRSQADADFDGDLEVKNLNDQEENAINTYLNTPTAGGGAGLSNAELQDEYDVSLDSVDHPDQIQFGVRYQIHPDFSLEGDVVWTRWSMVDDETVKIDDADAAVKYLLGGDEIVYERDWEDTRQVRIGAEWQTTDWLTLRGGYFYDPSPIPDDTFDAEWTDADKKTYSLGAGFALTDSWTVDTVLQYTTVEQDRIVGGESKNLNDSYESENIDNEAEVSTKADGEIWGYGLTVSYTF